MFGYHKAKRKKKQLEQEKSNFQDERNLLEGKTTEAEEANRQKMKQQIESEAQAAKDVRQKGREEGKAYAEEVFSNPFPGLDPKQKIAMQNEANKNIRRQMQSANRRLLGEQGRRGITGRSGVAFAQQQELEKLGQEARGQASRDLDKLDKDLELKKIAARVNLEQGEAAQSLLDRQTAIDQLALEEEKKRQRMYEDRFNRLFERV